MYRRLVATFCDAVAVESFNTYMVRRSDVAVRVSYSYISVADTAIANCQMVADSRKPLGSISIGRVVDRGVDVEDLYEGSRVAVFPIHSPQYLYSDGGAQDLVAIDKRYAKVVELKGYGDLDALLVAVLSVDRELLEYVKGRDVVLVGRDLSIASFAFYASRYSSRVAVVPRYFLSADLVKAEHVSLYEPAKPFDTIVIASFEPIALCLALRNLAKDRGSTAIVYPYAINSIGGVCVRSKDISIKSMLFGDIAVGLEVFESVRQLLAARLKVVDLNGVPKRIEEPLLVKL